MATRTEAWFNKYDRMPPDLQTALAGMTDVPVDIVPVFSFPEKVRERAVNRKRAIEIKGACWISSEWPTTIHRESH